jgi:hypothetical protein
MFESKKRTINMSGYVKEAHKLLKFENPCSNGSHFKFCTCLIAISPSHCA